jgi:hypothetical protein
MNDVRFFLGAASASTLSDVLEHSAALPAWAPFDARAVAFVARFSQCLLTDPQARRFPELIALAHWFRAARLKELASRYPRETHAAIVRGRGLAFHLAPANVDSVFMYSWLLSLLAGNVNIVRVSRKPSPQLDFLIGVLGRVLLEDAGAAVAGRFVLLTYPHDDSITRAISARCMARVVWGGDATVAAIRAIPLRPTAVELCFPDRFSLAAISAPSILALDDKRLATLAAHFYNDAFWFAQQACSSPRLLNWIGAPADVEPARRRFWSAVDAEVRIKQPENTGAMGMARLSASFEYAAARVARPASIADAGSFPTLLELEGPLSGSVKELHCGNGLFLEQRFDHLAALASRLSDKEQTLAHFGFARADVVALVDALPPRALDRVVPIGAALAFAPVWDGTDLITFFTRTITLDGGLQ